jgi:hypothetical protein
MTILPERPSTPPADYDETPATASRPLRSKNGMPAGANFAGANITNELESQVGHISIHDGESSDLQRASQRGRMQEEHSRTHMMY